MKGRRSKKLPSPVTKAREFIARFAGPLISRFTPNVRLFILALIFTLITTLLLGQSGSRQAMENYDVGDVVRSNIISPANISIIESEETTRRRSAVRNSIKPICIFDSNLAEEIATAFRASLDERAQKFKAGDAKTLRDPLIELLSARSAQGFSEVDFNRLTRLVREASENYIYDDDEAKYLAAENLLIDSRSGARLPLNAATGRLVNLSTARQNFRGQLTNLSGWRTQERITLSRLLPPLIKPNTRVDLTATEEAQRQAEAKIEPVRISLKRNQVIAREGDTVTEQMLDQFAAIRSYTKTGGRLGHYIGLFFVVGVLYWFVWRYSEQRSITSSRAISKVRVFSLVCSAVVMQTVFLHVGFTVARSVASVSIQPMFNDSSMLSLLIPGAAAPLLVTMLAGPPFGMLTGLIVAVFAGLMAPNGILMTLHVMVSSAASIYGIKKYRERQSITLAGLFVTGVSALSGIAVVLIAQQPFTFNTALVALGFGAIGGFLASIFAAGGLPINESFFGILTDIKLLELSNADLPVLSQLALRAPGTNQHSHAVGQLSEEACRAIGANALLARIGALYHDIGKLAAPHMFVENQTGDNPHDRMRPSNSARIIISHVIYGMKMAKELRLPKLIADFIPQHHGTRTLHCFLRKAQEQARSDEVIDETEFRYPGPKPQTKEAAVMMLSDSCEAAARSLTHPDLASIETIVKRIFDAVLSDQQLDECNLTLHEFNVIRESIIHSLTAIYHARVDYPDFNTSPSNSSMRIEENESLSAELQLGARFDSPDDVPISKGGEVEDEAVSRRAAGTSRTLQ